MTIRGYNIQVDGVQFNDLLIEDPPPFQLVGLASGQDFGITFTTVDMAGLESVPSAVFPASTPPGAPPVGADSPMNSTDVAFIDGVVNAALAAGNGPGISVSITGPRGYLTKSYGLAVKAGRALTPDDHWRIGSCTKTFTSTVVMRCVDQGLLSLDDTLDSYVTGVPFGDQITLRHLLTMRSGIHDYMTDTYTLIGFYLNPAANWSAANCLRLIKKGGKPPGVEFAYTNGTHVLLGLCVEAVTGRNIRNVILEDIVEPLGLTETKWPVDSRGYGIPPQPQPAAQGYGGLKGTTENASGYNIPGLTDAAGALCSTIGDLQKWGQALRDGTLLSPESQALVESTWFPIGIDPHDVPHAPPVVGYGLARYLVGRWVGHPGSVPGYECSLLYDPVSGAVIAISENSQSAPDGIALSPMMRVFPPIAEYLFPGSMDVQNMTGTTVKPASAVVSITGGTPVVSVIAEGALIPSSAVVSVIGGTPVVNVVHNKVLTPGSAVVSILGGIPGTNPIIIQPDAAVVTVTGRTPVVTVTPSFTPFSEENLNRISRAVPVGATEWRFTGIGAGGPGGAGRKNSVADQLRTGGGGGGGAAKVWTDWLPVSLLGSTYSVTQGVRGVGGVPSVGNGNGGSGTVGTASTFTSGSVSLSAGPGGAGTGGQANAGGFRGDGGTASATGATATIANGTLGTNGQSTSNPVIPADNTSGGGAGGGGGAGTSAADARRGGARGGNSATQAGGASGAIATSGGSTTATDPGVAGAGSGGGGSTVSGSTVKGGAALGYGAGGGGGGAAKSTAANTSGDDGGPSYTNIEWR